MPPVTLKYMPGGCGQQGVYDRDYKEVYEKVGQQKRQKR